MNLLLFLLPILLPILFWAVYHYYKDHCLPEPISHLVLAFMLGVASSYLAGWMYQALDLVDLRFDALLLAETSLVGTFAYAVLVIGVIEEAAKMLPFLLVVHRFSEFDEPIDGIIYASFIALGFATVENIEYARFATTAEVLARGFAGPVVHIVFASIWGYYIGKACLCRERMMRTVIAVLAFTAFLHGIYDFIVLALPPLAWTISALLIAGIWIWRLFLIKDLHEAPAGPCPPELDHASKGVRK